VKLLFSLAVLLASAVWADEAADRKTIEATISALNTSPPPSSLFTVDFPNAAELERLREEARLTTLRFPNEGVAIQPVPAEGASMRSLGGTVVISREPMGEATWYPAPMLIVPTGALEVSPRFATRSVTFLATGVAVVVALYGSVTRSVFPSVLLSGNWMDVPVLFVLKREGADWHVASFRVLTEAQPKAAP
jgi:hypothetical protein